MYTIADQALDDPRKIAIFVGGVGHASTWPAHLVHSKRDKINRWNDSTIEPCLSSPYVPFESLIFEQMTPKTRLGVGGFTEYTGEAVRVTNVYRLHHILHNEVFIYVVTDDPDTEGLANAVDN
jgi:hypothetical protein